jgi:hypothetical protein
MRPGTSLSSMNAVTRMRPPHLLQHSTSNSNTAATAPPRQAAALEEPMENAARIRETLLAFLRAA